MKQLQPSGASEDGDYAHEDFEDDGEKMAMSGPDGDDDLEPQMPKNDSAQKLANQRRRNQQQK